MSTTVATLGGGSTTTRLNLEAVRPRPATNRGLALPVLAVTDDGSGPHVRNFVLELPNIDVGGASVASRAGDQPIPAVFGSGPLAGYALTSPMRGVTFTTTGSAPVSVSFGQLPAVAAGTVPGSTAVAAAAVSFTPTARLSVTPQVLIPSGSPDASTKVGTAIRTKVADNVAVVTDLGLAGTASSTWSPLASARLTGHWRWAGIETSVLRGAAAPANGAEPFVVSRDREAAQAQVQPLPGLTVAALASASRPSSVPGADETTQGSLRIAYDGLGNGQVAAVRQQESTASREAKTTSLEWRKRGTERMIVRFVHRRAWDSSTSEADEGSSRVELDLPMFAPACGGCPNLRAALTAGSMTQSESGVSSTVSGRVALIDDTVLTGETRLGLTSGDGQVLRSLRVTTEVPVVPAARLQLSYAYRRGTQFPLGQVFEARILRRVSLGW